MKYPVKKMYDTQQERLKQEGYEVFAPEFFEEALLNFMSCLGDLYQAVYQKANRKDVMLIYVKGFRAVLNVGISLQCQEDISQPTLAKSNLFFRDQLFKTYECALSLRYALKDHSFYAMFSSYLGLGQILNLNFDDVHYVYENER